MQMLVQYKNGNAIVSLFDDGTKIIETQDREFDFAFASSMDICVSERCMNGCAFCYADCSPSGRFGSFDYPFLDTIRPGVEMAVNLQWPVPDGFDDFLVRMKCRGVIVNGTISQYDFEKEDRERLLESWIEKEYIHGIGISLVCPTDDLIRHIRQYKNAVVHTIAGVTALTDFHMLADHGLKVLILGYKMKGRGKAYYNEAVAGKICALKKELPALASGFDVLCFDNLALRQLEVKSRMPEEKWERCYMGDDSTSSFYVNLCDGTFSPSSLDELKLPIGELTAEEMFAKVTGRAAVC